MRTASEGSSPASEIVSQRLPSTQVESERSARVNFVCSSEAENRIPARRITSRRSRSILRSSPSSRPSGRKVNLYTAPGRRLRQGKRFMPASTTGVRSSGSRSCSDQMPDSVCPVPNVSTIAGGGGGAAATVAGDGGAGSPASHQASAAHPSATRYAGRGRFFQSSISSSASV